VTGRDLSPDQLDDHEDRAELRTRYQSLLQELRVVLPGVQVLLAFMLTAPFGSRFEQLDATGRNVFITALVAAFGSVVCLVAPPVFHRVADRTARVARLRWSVRLVVVGVALMGAALVLSLWCVVRFVHSTALATWLSAGGIALIVLVWVVLPVAVGRGQTNSK
jgi:hypothetical protein